MSGLDDSWTKEMEQTGGQAGAHDLMYGQGVQKSDLFAKFEIMAQPNAEQSKIAGRPIFEDVEIIRIFMPGGDEVCRTIQEDDKIKWPEAWEAWQNGKREAEVGTPLEQWTPINPASVAMFKAKGVYNVEGLSKLSDAHCETLGNWSFEWRERAQKWLKMADTAAQKAAEEAAEAERQELRNQVAELKAQMAAMNKPKRRGRPRKVRDDATGNDPANSGAAEPSQA